MVLLPGKRLLPKMQARILVRSRLGVGRLVLIQGNSDTHSNSNSNTITV